MSALCCGCDKEANSTCELHRPIVVKTVEIPSVVDRVAKMWREYYAKEEVQG